MYKINCDYKDGAVAVPTELIDKHLKLAPSASFKVLLFMLRNPDGATDKAVISQCTGLTVADVADCLDYWAQYGVIYMTDGENAAADKKAVGNMKTSSAGEAPVATEKKPPRLLPVKKPTQREIALRLKETPELGVIYSEAQSVLGTFGYDTEAIILMIYDYYGFPPEVIITLIQYQKSVGRASTAAIKSRAEDWASRGIDNLDAVSGEITALETIAEIYDKIKPQTGLTAELPSQKISRHIREWAVERGFSAEMILLALKESGNSFNEAGKLIKKWSLAGVKTPEAVDSGNKKSVPKKFKKSYNTEDIGKNSVLDWVKKYTGESEDDNA